MKPRTTAMHEQQPQHDELAWQAFRFVAGEMNAVEQQRFAALLADDQPAREAVASAVELSQAAAAAFKAEPTLRLQTNSHAARWAWLATGVALCLAVVVALLPWRSAPRVTASAADEALAVHWSEVREQQFANASWNDVAAENTIAEEGAALGSDEFTVPGEAIAATPDWMLAAVSQEREASDMLDDLPGDIERGGQSSQEQ